MLLIVIFSLTPQPITRALLRAITLGKSSSTITIEPHHKPPRSAIKITIALQDIDVARDS